MLNIIEKHCVELESGKLKLSVYPSTSKISLYWDSAELTKSNGFISIIGVDNGNRYYSERALWQINRVSNNEIQVLLEWPDLLLKEFWDIVLKDERTISWKVSLSSYDKISISEHEVGLKVSLDYARWLNSSEKGVFPPVSSRQTEWQDIKLKNFLSKAIGVRSCIKNDVYKPTIILDFQETIHHTTPQIRNSHTCDNLRGLFVLIQPNQNFTNNPINKRYDTFIGKVKLIDSDIVLAKNIKSYAKEDKKRWQAFLVKNTREINSYSDFFNYLLLRFIEHYRNKGFLYAAYRGIAYILYCIKRGNIIYTWIDLARSKKYSKNTMSEIHLESGKLRLSVNTFRRSIDIYWSGVKLTKNLGLIAVVNDRAFIWGRRYSNQALWQVSKPLPNQISISLHWPGSPLNQMWQITLEDEKTIKWEIEIISERKIILEEKEAGITLSPDYTSWINLYEEGRFLNIEPIQTEWKDMDSWNLSSSFLGARSCLQNQEFKPAIILDFEDTKEDTKPIARNSDYQNNLRALLVQTRQHKSMPYYDAGILYKIFSSKIKIIEDEELIDQHIINCKKRLYRQRLPFIEEKMNKKYLANILKPVEVVLANLPWEKDNRWGVRAGSRWPHIKSDSEEAYLPFPFFLAYTASIFLERGVSVRIIDAIAEKMDCNNFIKLINELEPKLLIAEVSTPSLENDLEILKKINRQNTKIAVCGLDFNIRQPDFFKKNDFIDFTMVGEYEYTAFDLFQQINKGNSFEKVLGLIYRENGHIKLNPPKPLIEDLDKLPWPLREQLPLEQYMDTPGNIAVPSVQMLASRGCPFKCIFCAWPQLMYNSNRYRMRKAEAIVDEMEYLIKERKVKSIYFDDDTFNINKKNVLAICKEIKERNLNVPWAIMARADTMDEEMLIRMKESGLYAVKYGVESADQELLDNARKGMNLRQAEHMIRFTKSLGIKIHLTFAFGLPGETKASIERTVDYALSLDPDTIQFSIMTPYPGTEYYRQLDAKGYIVSRNWSDYDGASKSVIKTEHLSPVDLEKAKEEALRRWKKHKRAKRSFISMPLDKELRAAFRNNLNTKGLIPTLFKTIKYILNIN